MIATQGHQDQSIRIQKNLSSECQMMLFSATYDQDVMNFAENVIANPVVSSVANHFFYEHLLRTHYLSATYVHNILSPINLNFRGLLQIIRLRREEESIDNIGQYWVQCETEELKYNAIANIYGVVTIGQAMIFCQTRKTASWYVCVNCTSTLQKYVGYA